jgi:DNA-binding MarR family transcriptional regulator
MITETLDTTALANSLRPVLLKLNRELRREIHSLGVTGVQATLLVQIKQSPGIGIRELAEAGLIDRGPVAGDRRRVGLVVTPAGHRVLRSVKSKRTAWLSERLGQLEPEQLEAIDAAVEPLMRLLDEERA